MSNTPRTDEQINGKPCTQFEYLAGDSLRNALVPSEFARQLERELNAANIRIKRLEEAGNAMYLHNGIHGSCKFCRELEARWIKAKNDKP